MAEKNEEAIKALNELIGTCKDGENGYRTAAGAVKPPDLKQLFNSYAGQRALFATELQGLVQQLGGTPATSGSITATIHRGWLNVKSLVSGGDDSVIFAECERGEDA